MGTTGTSQAGGPRAAAMVFQLARQAVGLRRGAANLSSLLSTATEVCLPVGDTYHWNGMKLDPKYAVACSCKRPGFSAYLTACSTDGGLGPVNSLEDEARNPFLQSSQ